MTQNNEREALIEDEFNKQYPYDDMDGWDRKLFKSGYQAATQASESEINSLKERVEELQADNNQLREALKQADEFITNGIEFGFIRMPDDDLKGIDSAHDTPEIVRKALSSTPTQSLVEHDNEVIEGCAKVCDYYAVNAFNSSSRNAAIELAVAIRNIEYEKLEGK